LERTYITSLGTGDRSIGKCSLRTNKMEVTILSPYSRKNGGGPVRAIGERDVGAKSGRERVRHLSELKRKVISRERSREMQSSRRGGETAKCVIVPPEALLGRRLAK